MPYLRYVMAFKTQSILPEIDGGKLKQAREAQSLSQQDLATKVCLSHHHIAQLEGNQLAIFFSPAHKNQVAKKVGQALGLSEEDFLIYRNAKNGSDTSEAPSGKLMYPVILPKNENLFTNTGSQLTSPKSKFILIPALITTCIAFGLATQIYSEELLFPSLTQLMTFKSPMTQLQPTNPRNPAVIEIAIETVAPVVVESEPINPLSLVNEEPCAYQESDLLRYQTTNPRKKGEMVYILSKEHQTVCIIDNQNKVVSLDLEAGDSQSVYGQAPFTLVSSDLSKFDLYFQGWKVRSSTFTAKAIRLEEADYLAINAL